VITSRVAVPAVKFTVAEWVITTEFNVPDTVAVPALEADVNVALYVPLLLFVTEPSVPNVVARATVPPLTVRLLPLASFNWTPMVEVLDPLAVIDVGFAVIVDVAVEAAPGFITIDPDVPAGLPDAAVNVPVPDVPV
jgi:hypothetical protein